MKRGERLKAFSVRREGRYIKLFFAFVSGYLAAEALGFKLAAPFVAASAWMTPSLSSSLKENKLFFMQRVMANFAAIPLGLFLFRLFGHEFAAMAVTAALMLFLVWLQPKVFRLTSLGVALSLIAAVGVDLSSAVERVLGVAIGMAYGYLVDLIVLPPDHGYKFRRDLLKALPQLANQLTALAGQRGFAPIETDSSKVIQAAVQLKDDLNTLKKDVVLRESRHLRRYAAFIKLYEAQEALLASGSRLLAKLALYRQEFSFLPIAVQNKIWDDLACLAQNSQILCRRLQSPAGSELCFFCAMEIGPASNNQLGALVLQSAVIEYAEALRFADKLSLAALAQKKDRSFGSVSQKRGFWRR